MFFFVFLSIKQTRVYKTETVIAQITSEQTTNSNQGFNWTVIVPLIHHKLIVNTSDYEINSNFNLLKILPYW